MMSCKRKIRSKEEDETSNISGQNPKFFKVILLDTLRQGRLAIPKKFVRNFGDCLSSNIILKAADGIEWQMELSEGGIYEAWLDKGWKEFSDYYSLKHGYFLVFQHQHKSNFIVLIFDTTLLEIDYPGKPNFIPNFKQNPNRSIGFIKTEDSESGNLEFQGEYDGRRNPLSLESANEFRSTNPWFKLVVRSSNKAGGKIYSRNVPFQFMREHMERNMETETKTVILKVEGKKSKWQTKMNVYWVHSSAMLSAGWSSFVRDNGLKNSDVCVFELLATNTFMVHIFKNLPQ